MTQTSRSVVRRAFAAAFPRTLPILAGFLFLGFAYGLMMHANGFSFLYPMCMAMTIFGGSLEYVTVSMLLSTFAPMQTLLMALLIQARHLFYGLSLLKKYAGTGWKKPLLIFGLCDETFSITCSSDVPDGVDRGWFYLWVTVLDWVYWVLGAALGGLLGDFFPFSTEGIDFVMTAMFVVIFVDNFLKEKQHWSSLIGIAVPTLCLLIFHADGFMIPSMLCILMLLLIFRKCLAPLTEGDDAQ